MSAPERPLADSPIVGSYESMVILAVVVEEFDRLLAELKGAPLFQVCEVTSGMVLLLDSLLSRCVPLLPQDHGTAYLLPIAKSIGTTAAGVRERYHLQPREGV